MSTRRLGVRRGNFRGAESVVQVMKQNTKRALRQSERENMDPENVPDEWLPLLSPGNYQRRSHRPKDKNDDPEDKL